MTAPDAATTRDAILDAAEEVPYNVQLLAHTCWEACRAELGAGESQERQQGTRGRAARPVPHVLTPDLVAETRDTVALRSDPLYTQLWSSLAASQQKALVALIRERGEQLTSTDVARRYKVPVPTMQKALKALEAKAIVREEQSRGAVRLRLEDPLFGAWVQLVVPR